MKKIINCKKGKKIMRKIFIYTSLIMSNLAFSEDNKNDNKGSFLYDLLISKNNLKIESIKNGFSEIYSAKNCFFTLQIKTFLDSKNGSFVIKNNEKQISTIKDSDESEVIISKLSDAFTNTRNITINKGLNTLEIDFFWYPNTKDIPRITIKNNFYKNSFDSNFSYATGCVFIDVGN